MSKPPVQEENGEENFRDSDAETINPEARDSLDGMDDELPEADRDTIYGAKDVEEAQKNVHTIAEKSQTALKFNPTQAKSAFASMKAVLEGTKTNEEKVAEIETLQSGVEDTATQAFANVAKGVLGLQETQATAQEKSDTLKELVSEFGFIENLGDDEKDPAAKEQCSLNMVQAVGAMQAKKDADGKLIEPAEVRDNLNPHIVEAIQTSFKTTVDDAIEVESKNNIAAEEKKKSEVKTNEDYKDLDLTPAIRCGKTAVAIGLALGVPGVGFFLAVGFLIATRNMGNGPQQEDGEEKENDLPDMDLLGYGEEFLKDFLESGEGPEHPHQEHEEEEVEKWEELEPEEKEVTKKSVHAKPSVAAKNSPEGHEEEEDENEAEEPDLSSSKKPIPAKKVTVSSAIDNPNLSFHGLFDEEPQVEEEGEGFGRESDVGDFDREDGELEYEGWEYDLGTVQESVLGAPTSPYQPIPAKFLTSTAKSNTAAPIYHDATAEDVQGLVEREELYEDEAPPVVGKVWMSLGDIDLTLRSHVDIGEMDRESPEFIDLTEGTPSQVGMEAKKVEVEVTGELSHNHNVLGSTHKSLARITSMEDPLQGAGEVDQDAVATQKARINQTKGIVPSDEDELSEEDERLLASVNAMRANELNPNQEEKKIVAAKLNDMVVAEVDSINDEELLENAKVDFSDHEAARSPSILMRMRNFFKSSRPAVAASVPEEIEMDTVTSNPLNEKGLTASSLTAEQADLLASSGKAQSQFTQNPVAGNSSAHQEEDEMRDEDDEVWDEPEESRLRRKAIMDYKKMHPTTQQPFESAEFLEPDEESMDVEEPHLNNPSPVTVVTTDEEFSQSEAKAAAKAVVASTSSLSDFSEGDGQNAHSPHMANPAKVKDKDAKVV